ncbi:dihydrodipicolinate synthase family protein [Nocardiopsis coralliicola]
MKIDLPAADGTLVPHTLNAPAPAAAAPVRAGGARIAYAAAHVVADPYAEPTGGAVDWDATLAFRRHLWAHGLGVAEAMDTAQRGAGLTWPLTRELIARTGREAQRAAPGEQRLLVCGAGTDQLPPGPAPLDAIAAAYEEQLAVVEEAGARPVIMASRQLAASARGPEDYAAVYGRLLPQLRRPAVLHWLGTMFDPQLAGYWGSADLDSAASALLDLIGAHADRVDGVKISLLDAGRETAFRRALPDGVRLYTGDDFHYPELILGDGEGHSDALLGVFDPIAPAAAAALSALERGDTAAYRDLFAPTVPLARHLFAEPTYHYKTGVVFLAWLAGHQSHFRMVGGAESARGLLHLAELFRLADAAGLFPDPDAAAERMRSWLAVSGAAR